MSHEAVTWVLEHSGAAGTDKVLLLSLAHHMNKMTGTAWPSIETLARHAGVTERSAQRALRRLEAAGEVSISVRTGGARDARYRTNVYEFPRMRGDAGVAPEPSQEVTQASPLDAQEVTSTTLRGDVSGPQEVTPVSPEQSENLLENTHGDSAPGTVSLAAARRERLEREFDEFWKLYPRHDARKGALKAWVRLTQAERDVALDAVARYAILVKRNKTEKRFIPHGATWLNQQRWEDVPGELSERRTQIIGGARMSEGAMNRW